MPLATADGCRVEPGMTNLSGVHPRVEPGVDESERGDVITRAGP